MTQTYSAEEIFQNDPENPENTLMKIPEEITEEMGWKPGDILEISILEEGGISIIKVENE